MTAQQLAQVSARFAALAKKVSGNVRSSPTACAAAATTWWVNLLVGKNSALIAIAALFLFACASTPLVTPERHANFNHFYLVVDEETASAIATSEVLARFASRRVIDADASDTFYAGRYLYGYQTYAEFFDPEGFDLRTDVPARIGLFGIAVGGDEFGDLNRVAATMEEKGIPTERSMRMMTTRDGKEIPHFEKVARAGAPDTENYLWALEYQPELFELIRETSDDPAIQSADPTDVSRWIYNEWRYRANLQMKDLVGIDATIGKDEAGDFASFLEASGFVVDMQKGGFVAKGNEVRLRFQISQTDNSGITALMFSLNQSLERQEIHEIGDSKLSLGPGPEAIWVFSLQPTATAGANKPAQ